MSRAHKAPSCGRTTRWSAQWGIDENQNKGIDRAGALRIVVIAVYREDRYADVEVWIFVVDSRKAVKETLC